MQARAPRRCRWYSPEILGAFNGGAEFIFIADHEAAHSGITWRLPVRSGPIRRAKAFFVSGLGLANSLLRFPNLDGELQVDQLMLLR